MFIKAYASGSKGGKAGYERAVARQLANEAGVSVRQARKVTRANAAASRSGRRSSGANVRKKALRALGR